MNNDLTIHSMDVAGLKTVLGWAADEGWNPGLDDAPAFYAADPGGFFLACMSDTPVAAISVVNHDAENAFLGLYLCRPDWRGRGIGLRTWEHAMAHAGERSVGLDGVPDQEANYRKSGFVRTGQTLRYTGRWPGHVSPAIRSATEDDMATLSDLDARANGFVRPRFLQAWLSPFSPKRQTRVLETDGEIRGFATWRACRDGTKFGPIVAPDTQSALDLISDVAALRTNGPLIIDVPDANTVLRLELEAAGFEVPFTTARMYRGRAPAPDASLQAIATMELG